MVLEKTYREKSSDINLVYNVIAKTGKMFQKQKIWDIFALDAFRFQLTKPKEISR